MSDKIHTLPIKLSVPDSFYQEDERCSYIVSEEMKRIWAVELDLLAEFDRVCKKYNLPYVATGGTLLGAVRHKGFIPWDDDIDLGMKREHYQNLCEVAQQEFIHPYFFQTEWTDPTSLRGHAQLRNSETTAIIDVEQNKLINQGIFIDIFPLDNVIDDVSLFKAQMDYARKLRNKARELVVYTDYVDYINNHKSFKKKLKPIVKFLLKPFNRLIINKVDNYYKLFEEECQRYNKTKTQFLGMLSFKLDEKKLFIETNDFENSIKYIEFEFFRIPVLGYYDQLLTRQYGDWKKPVKASTYHGTILFDTDKSYKEYINNGSKKSKT